MSESTTRASMSVPRETMLMLTTQLRYRQSTVFMALLLELGCLCFFLLLAESRERWVVAVIAAMLGGVVNIFGFGVDAFERRIRLLVMLPVTRTAVALSRLLGPLVLQVLFTSVAWLLALGISLLRGEEMPPIGVFVLAATWSLALIYLSFVFEEINVALSGSKIAVYAVNVGLFILSGVAVMTFDHFFSSAGEVGFLLAMPVTVVLFLLSVVLFRRRRTLDVGVNPWHGLPTDWSES